MQRGKSPAASGSINGAVGLRVPLEVIKAKRAPYRRHGKPWHRSALQNLDDYDIVQDLRAEEYRGIVGYYLLAADVWRLGDVHWHALTSMLKTLAAKHQSTVSRMATKHQAKIQTPVRATEVLRGQDPPQRQAGPGSPVRRDPPGARHGRGAPGPCPQTGPPPPQGADPPAPATGGCELCGDPGKVLVHQVRKLTSLGPAGPNQPAWAALMARKRRKTLVVCHPCHDAIHTNPATTAA